jgi:LysR family glycine cleavage system transcriptional activator
MLSPARRKLPPLNALRFFEAAARHCSFATAADELCVTPAAVSRQVRSLEAGLGVNLFRRHPQHLEITPAGVRLAATVRAALDAIEQEARRFEKEQNEVCIGVSPNFGTRWMSSRLRAFRADHPAIRLVIEAREELSDLSTGDVDFVVRFGDGHWPDAVTDLLFGGPLVAVVDPQLVREHRLRGSKIVGELPLIHVERTDDWASWLGAAGMRSAAERAETIVSHAHLAVEAALHGAGVALVHSALVVRELSQRHLQLASPRTLESAKGYWLARSSHHKPTKAAKIAMEWFRKRAQLEGVTLRQAVG